MPKPLQALMFWLLVSSGASALPVDQAKRKNLSYDGRERSYIVHTPPHSKAPIPLLILLHGGGGNAAQALRSYPLAQVADREGFLLVAPDGSGPLKRHALLTWNVGWGFGYAQRQHIDDIGFIRALIKQLQKDYPVDSHRIYLTGMSNGAILCHNAAAANADIIAGIAPVSGCVAGGESPELVYPAKPARPVNVIMFNGALDKHIPLAGGLQQAHAERKVRYVCSAQASAQFWVKANHCNPTAKVEELPKQKATRYSWTGGQHNTSVVLWVLHNQGHAWPGGQASRAVADQPSQLLRAQEVMWQFFQNTKP